MNKDEKNIISRKQVKAGLFVFMEPQLLFGLTNIDSGTTNHGILLNMFYCLLLIRLCSTYLPNSIKIFLDAENVGSSADF
jgi:hypothetical protein